jgi:hypothetical protein
MHLQLCRYSSLCTFNFVGLQVCVSSTLSVFNFVYLQLCRSSTLSSSSSSLQLCLIQLCHPPVREDSRPYGEGLRTRSRLHWCNLTSPATADSMWSRSTRPVRIQSSQWSRPAISGLCYPTWDEENGFPFNRAHFDDVYGIL